MKPVVVAQLGVKRGDEQMALLCGDDATVLQSRQDGDIGAGRLQDRRSDEDRVQRLLAELWDRQVGLEAVELAPERIAARGSIEKRKRRLALWPPLGDLLCHEDRAGA